MYIEYILRTFSWRAPWSLYIRIRTWRCAVTSKGEGMHSAIATTHETFDMELAAADLAKQIKAQMPSVKNNCGILFVDPDYDMETMLPLLQEALNMDIVGATSAAMLSSQGYHTLCATLLVMGGDDCVFGSAISPALESGTVAEQLQATYDRALAKLGGEVPKVVFAFSASSVSCTEDDKLGILNRLSDGIPVFGGIAADHFEFAHTKVFGEGRVEDSSVVLLLAGGNIKPRFLMRNVTRKQLSKSTVTSSSGSVVHSIDGMSAYDYMLQHGADPSTAMSLHFTPLLVETNHGGDDGPTICRPFFSLDQETGFGATISEIPTGSAVTVQSIQGSDILEASKDGIESMARELQDDDYPYSTILFISCAARHMVLAFDKDKEAELGKAIFPPHIKFAGFYSFGEFCPISMASGKADNRLHNLSMGLCAL